MISWKDTFWWQNGKAVASADAPRLILLWADGVHFDPNTTRGPYASVKAALEARMIWRLKRGEVSTEGLPGSQLDIFA